LVVEVLVVMNMPLEAAVLVRLQYSIRLHLLAVVLVRVRVAVQVVPVVLVVEVRVKQLQQEALEIPQHNLLPKEIAAGPELQQPPPALAVEVEPVALVETVAELTGVMVVLDQSQQLILFNEQVVVVEVSVAQGLRVERVEQVVGATDKLRFLRRELPAVDLRLQLLPLAQAMSHSHRENKWHITHF
jgi:hypothetical protein